MDTEILRQHLYASSPFDLTSDSDNAYRDLVDFVLNPKQCANCGEIVSCLIRAHHHTVKGIDVTV